MRRLIVMISVVVASYTTPGLAADHEARTCGADQMQDLIGQPVVGMPDRLSETVRIIPPDSVVTQDFRPDRMNVDLDADGIIIRIWCG